MRGVFVCIEGIDGAGKKTQAEMLHKYLSEAGVRSAVYSYPNYGSRYGKILKGFLDGDIEMGVEEQFLLNLIDKEQNRREILKSLNEGMVVITDRYLISNIAYQVAGSFDYDAAKRIIELVKFPEPDVIFYLDVPVSVSTERKTRQKGRIDRFERASEYLVKVRNIYEMLYADEYGSENWIKLDGTQNIANVNSAIISEVDRLRMLSG